jgi:hypothetical protein
MMSSPHQAEDLPPVDARLVAPNSGWEIIDGKAVEVPGCDEPHGTRQSKVTALLEAAVREDFDVAVEMLTRTSKIDDFAPDVSVFPRARDPLTGGRQIEQLAFEVLSTQTLSKAGEKAAKLAGRGVRRLFAVDIRRDRVFEWARDAATWRLLPDAGAIEDVCLAAPLPVDALVRAARADDAVARALLAKRNAVVVAAVEEGREEGRIEALRRAVIDLAEARGLALTRSQRQRLDDCSDLAQLQLWHRRLATVAAAHDAFEAD